MQRKKRNSFDKMGFGLLVGFAVPAIIFFLVYYFGDSNISFTNYVSGLWHVQALVKLGSLCVFANLAVFMGFLRIKYEQAARGVLGATIVYALVVLISRVV